MASKTWLITGCSSGLGENFVHEIIERGDKAIATARGDISRLSALKDAGAYVYSLDVNAPFETTKSLLAQIIEEVGPIDVLVNNAGYMEVGFVEELR
jgi:NAD(P)-dependent dehydrogenase (short-subunit alcohol dehydrogenase family)